MAAHVYNHWISTELTKRVVHNLKLQSRFKLCTWIIPREPTVYMETLLVPSRPYSKMPLRNPICSVHSALSCSLLFPCSRNIHSTHVISGKRRVKKPIQFKMKGKGKVIFVWKNMTVMDLAKGLDKTVDELFEVFLYVEGSETFDRPSSSITDLNVIKHAVKLTGNHCQIKAPDPDPKDSVDTVMKDAFPSSPARLEDLEPRPPIVTIMGHVDHGKTTLLDTLRQSSIVDSEFGGITQHIGAFEVSLPSGEQVTFLDTPGHAAFSAMRARGANVTDMVVLVVAADDGVLPQTEESVKLARLSDTPIIVAINKIDKSDADVERTKQMLLNVGLQLEEQGGDVQAVEISALKGTNVPLLVEALVTQAELMNLKATKKGLVEGTVIESELDLRRGKTATCIVRRGTLTKGAIIVAETSWAKVRSLFDSNGRPVDKVLPGTPAVVIGWKDSLPPAGAEILEVKSDRRAREVVALRENEKKRQKGLEDWEAIQKKAEEHLKEYNAAREARLQLGFRRKMYRGRPPLEKLYKDDPRPRVSLVLKGDVDGSIEAILDVLETYHSEEVLMDILSYGIGTVTPSDVEIASLFDGIIYTFNIGVGKDAKQLATQSGVPIREHNIIYRLVEDLQEEISKKLPLKPSEEVVGEATVQQEFVIKEGKKKIPVAGCRCDKGNLKKDLSFKVVRGLTVIHEGDIESLRHLKKEVESIKKDVECGIRFADPNVRFEPGDTLICYRVNMVPQKTDWTPDGFQYVSS